MPLEEKNPTRNRLAGLVMAGSGYYYGYCFPIFNTMAKPMFNGYFGLPEEEVESIQGTLNFLFCFAAMFGVLSLAYFNNRFGRITTSKGLDLLIIVVAIIYQFDSIYTILFARLLSGFITGMYNMNAAVALVELMPTELMGQCNMIQSMLSGTFSLVNFAQQVLLSQETMAAYWRLLLVWPCAISVMRLAFFQIYFIADTPVHVFFQWRDDPSLRDRLKQSFSMVYAEAGLAEHIDSFILERSQFELQSVSFWASNLELFTPKYLSRTIGALLLKITEAFAGFPFLIMFSTVFFEKIGIDGKIISLVFGVFYLVGATVALFIVNKFKRVELMVGGMLVQGVAFLLMYIFVLSGLLFPIAVSLALYITAYIAAIGSLNGVYMTEILPAYGIGVSIGLGWLLWSFIGKVSISLAAFLGETNTLLFFGVLCFSFTWLLKRYLVEVNNIKIDGDLQEIEKPLVEMKIKQ